MACSDNVVRAGLTPKYQDVETLVLMLEYGMVPAESRKFQGSKVDQFTTFYNPPVPDFAVDMIEVNIHLASLLCLCVCGGLFCTPKDKLYILVECINVNLHNNCCFDLTFQCYNQLYQIYE